MRSCISPTTLAASLLLAIVGSAQAQPTLSKALGAISLGLDLPEDSYGFLVSVGDFDHDSDRDLLLADVVNEQAWIMLDDGNGNYDPIGPFEIGNTLAVVAGQFDNDADPEVAFRDPGFSYFISYGPDEAPIEFEDFSFAYFGSFDNEDAFAPVIRAADFDADGLDEIVINSTSERIYVMWSSTGVTSPIVLNGLGEENALYEPGDYDGDGDLDLLVMSHDTEHFWVIEGTGTASMNAREILRSYPSIVQDNRPAFGQLDADPAIDMIVADASDQSMRSEFNFVNADFSTQPINAGEFALPLAIVSDLDGSGEPDLVVMRVNQFVPSAFPDFIPGVLYDPTGLNPSVADLDAGAPQRDIPYFQDTLFDGVPLTSVTAMDIDHDGDDDLVWHGFSDPTGRSLWAIENRQGIAGVPLIGMPSFGAVDGTLNLLAIDVDEDGYDEIIISGNSNMRILDLQDGTLDRITASSDAFMVVSADLDGDGTPEIVNSDNGVNRLRVWSILPGGGVGNRMVFPTADRGPYLGLEVADFNNDGLDDIAAMVFNGGVDVYLGGSGPSLTLWGSIMPEGTSGIKPGVLDYNSDGFPDIAIGNFFSGGIRLYTNNSDGTFTEGPVPNFETPDFSSYWIETGDIDLDGITDIVYSNNSFLGSTHILFLNADGSLSESCEIQAGIVVEIFIDDLTGDGLPDLAVAANMTPISRNQPGVIPQVSARSFGPIVMVPGHNSQSVALSDLNLDGATDMVSVTADELKLRAYYGTPNPCPADLTGDGNLNFFDVSEFLVNQPDYNSDGVFNFFDVAAFISDFSAGCS